MYKSLVDFDRIAPKIFIFIKNVLKFNFLKWCLKIIIRNLSNKSAKWYCGHQTPICNR